VYAQIARVSPRVRLVSLSENQRTPRPELNWLATCHNAIDLDSYPIHTGNDGYLLFLGRMSPDKGAGNAVRVARESGTPLLLAGKIHDPIEHEYFDAAVRPYLGDGIEYVGEVSHNEKVELLQKAAVTVFPIQWPEPFGLVMVESMACGTPVLATRLGAVPEVVEHGRSGLVVDTIDEMAACIPELLALDPLEVRAVADESFSAKRMVDDYERAYALLLAEQ
jgi:glycosyltransferase involved in cell wall biosynthesis